ncbi:MAG: hypothetical protein ACE5GI_05820, partial [Candidatus Aminicenantales bacterium]
MKKRLSFFLVTAFLFSLSLSSAANRPLTFNEFIKIKRVSDLQLSPVGDQIAFVVTNMDCAHNRGQSHIWIVSSRGGSPWPLTSGLGSDYNPRWSPDGKKIAFISSRGGTPQIWAINIAGGEATQISDFPGGVESFIWSPNGKQLVLAAATFPDCSTVECLSQKYEENKKSKIKAKIFEHLLFRHWNTWRNGKRTHLFLMSIPDKKASDLTPGDFDTPPIALGSSQDYAFSPDGQELCFVRNIDPNFRISLGTNNDLFLTTPKAGKIDQITTNKANDNSPHYSPDGRYLAYRAMHRPGFEADKYDLLLYDRQQKTTAILTATLDCSVDEIIWSPDSSSLYFTFEEKGRITLARLFLSQKKLEIILRGHYLNSL